MNYLVVLIFLVVVFLIGTWTAINIRKEAKKAKMAKNSATYTERPLDVLPADPYAILKNRARAEKLGIKVGPAGRRDGLDDIDIARKRLPDTPNTDYTYTL